MIMMIKRWEENLGMDMFMALKLVIVSCVYT